MGLKILLKDSKIPIFYDRAGIINKKYIDTEKKTLIYVTWFPSYAFKM